MSDTKNILSIDNALSIDIETHGTTRVLRPSGKITVRSAVEFDDAVTQAFEYGMTDVRLEMAGVEYIASAGLRVIVQGAKWARAHEGTFVIAHPTEEVYEVLSMTGLTDVLSIER